MCISNKRVMGALMKKTILVLIISVFFSGICCAEYTNNLRTEFLSGNSNILGVNLRTFNAKDLNGNEIIDEGEESGNFINAIERLDEIKGMGINTLHVLPITPVGKLKALGTAGSLYAISSFDKINPQLADKSSELLLISQAKKFVEECHKRGIRVIIDLPSCGSYDLFLTNPELFIKDEKQCSIVPADWTDVRLFNTGNDNKLNHDVMAAHKKFIDKIIELKADGIRADVATIKPQSFWAEIIKYARNKDPEFLFLAEASDSWREPPSSYAEFTPYDKLLEVGFDGYYGSFFNLKDWNAQELTEHVKFNKKLINSYDTSKNVILSFTTHDEISPVILHGEDFSIMIAWLSATLPYNPYYIDGFQSGDTYIYPWANQKTEVTETDDDFYFVHRGKIDIFNFSRKPEGKNYVILENFKNALKFRNENKELVTNGEFIPLKTNNAHIFGYVIKNGNSEIIVLGNLDFKNGYEHLNIKMPKVQKNCKIEFIHGGNIKLGRKNIQTNLGSGEIKVLKITK